jgi:hypothetical protein
MTDAEKKVLEETIKAKIEAGDYTSIHIDGLFDEKEKTEDEYTGFFANIKSAIDNAAIAVVAQARKAKMWYKLNRKGIRSTINTGLLTYSESFDDYLQITYGVMEDLLKSPKMMSAVAATIAGVKNIEKRVEGDKDLQATIQLYDHLGDFNDEKAGKTKSAEVTNDDLMRICDSLVASGDVDCDFRLWLGRKLRAEKKAADKRKASDEKLDSTVKTSFALEDFDFRKGWGGKNEMIAYVGAVEIERLYAELQKEKAKAEKPEEK